MPASRPIVLGVLRCLRPWIVEPEVVGVRFPGRVGHALVHVVVPTYQVPDEVLDMDDLSASRKQDDRVVPDELWQEVATATSAPPPSEPPAAGDLALGERVPQAEVHRLLLCVEGPAEELPEPREGFGATPVARLAGQLREHAERWYETAAAWIEVYTEQDLDHVAPRYDAWVEGGGLATFQATGGRTRASGRMTVTMHDETPASPALFAHAVAMASDERPPPLPHLLLRDARAAIARGERRRAVIDAATATEIALALWARYGEIEIKPRPTLGSFMHALEREDVISEGARDHLLKHLVDVRNDAVHRGATPEAGAAERAVMIAATAVRQFVALDPL